jgi:hypothetical protein
MNDLVFVGKWNVKRTIDGTGFKLHNYTEKYMIYYRETLVGFVFYSDIDKDYWVRISNRRIRRKFYKDGDKFYNQELVNGEIFRRK